MKLYASGEDYLEAILVLKNKLGMVRSVDVARHLSDIYRATMKQIYEKCCVTSACIVY